MALLSYSVVSGSVEKETEGSLGANLDTTVIPGTLDTCSKANPATGVQGA